MTTRLSVVDDTSGRIQYAGNWKSTKHGEEETGIFFGPSVNHTTHDLSSGGGSISFAFNGTYIQPLGTIDTTTGRLAPTWTCLVDGVSIPVNPSQNPNFKTTNANLCEAYLAAGSHVLTLNITPPADKPFLFGIDWIAYSPLQSAAESDLGDILYVPNLDPAGGVSVGEGWTTDGIATFTSTKGAQMVFKFNGTRVQAMGFSPEGEVNNDGATYSIDGGSAVSFDIPGGSTEHFNTILFEVDGLSPTNAHSVTLTFTGNSSKVPLELDHFFVWNVPLDTSSPSTTSPTTSTITTSKADSTGTSTGGVPSPGTDSSSGASSTSTPTGAIAGGVVGGIVFILLLFVLAFLYRRRGRQKSNDEFHEASLKSPTPYILSPGPPPGLTDGNSGPPPTSTAPSFNPWTKGGGGGSRPSTPGVIRSDSGSMITSSIGTRTDPGFAGVGTSGKQRRRPPLGLATPEQASPGLSESSMAETQRQQLAPVRAVDSGIRLRDTGTLPPDYTEE